MRLVLGITVFMAGCASGATLGPGQDAAQHDAPVVVDSPPGRDAHVVIDGALDHDAPLPPDAAVPIDAPTVHDAPPPIDGAPPPPDACVPQNTQLLANPTFDLTPTGTGWAQTQQDGLALIGADVSPQQSPPFAAFLGGVVSETDFLTQDIAIPAGTTKLELTGFYAAITDETTGTLVFDRSDLAITKTDGTPIEDVLPLTNLSAVNTWTPFDHVFTNLGALSGTTVRVRMTSTNDISNQTSFFFDTFGLTATHGCP